MLKTLKNSLYRSTAGPEHSAGGASVVIAGAGAPSRPGMTTVAGAWFASDMTPILRGVAALGPPRATNPGRRWPSHGPGDEPGPPVPGLWDVPTYNPTDVEPLCSRSLRSPPPRCAR